jgi:nucleotide-binding universal stress UspA family protein
VDLLTMGITEREGFAQSSYNITTEKMVQSSFVPFLTTRFPLQKDSIRSILAPVAFSDDYQEEIDFAVQFAKRFDSKVEFLHVIEDRKDPGYRAVESSLQTLREFVGSKDVDYACTAIEGKTSEKITEYAGDVGAELIIMTIRESNKTGYSSSVMDIITSVPCPVFAVPGQ